MNAIHSPTFVFEGTERPSNIVALNQLAAESRNPAVQLYPVRGVSHFSILSPVTRLVADKIGRDTGPAVTIDFTAAGLDAAVRPRSRPGGRPTTSTTSTTSTTRGAAR